MAESFVLYTEELPGFESSVVVNTLEMEATAVLSTLLKYRPLALTQAASSKMQQEDLYKEGITACQG